MDKGPVYDLVAKLQIMKPNKIKDDNLKQKLKLDEILKSPDYAAEEKIDGIHTIQCASLLFSKDHVERTDNYPHIRDFFISLGMPNLILDGEINYPGRTSQYCTRVSGSDPSNAVQFQKDNGFIHYTLFDILRTPKGTWLIKEPYSTRRKILEHFYNTYVKGSKIEPYMHITAMTIENKEQFKDAILARGGEGIVLKRLSSFYIMGKRPMWEWMKIKQSDETDLIITGFEPPTKEYSGTDFDNWPYWEGEGDTMMPVSKPYYFRWVGAIVLGAYVDGVLTRICTSSGMDEATRKAMSEEPDSYIGKVAMVEFMEKTDAGYPRHPSFVGLHPDKTPEECIWELN